MAESAGAPRWSGASWRGMSTYRGRCHRTLPDGAVRGGAAGPGRADRAPPAARRADAQRTRTLTPPSPGASAGRYAAPRGQVSKGVERAGLARVPGEVYGGEYPGMTTSHFEVPATPARPNWGCHVRSAS